MLVELKTDTFKPEHTRQLNFYLTAVDTQLKVEANKPHRRGRASISEALPAELQTSLPSIEKIEPELGAFR